MRKMKMKHTHILLTPALAFMVSSCAGEVIVQEPLSGGKALQVRSVELPEPSATRIQGATATQLTEIGVYATDHEHAALASNAKSVFKLQSETWSSDTPPAILSEESAPSRLYAFSPSGLSVTNGAGGNHHTVPVQVVADNFSASRQTDYLYADPNTAWASSRAVIFTMNHALAKVSFRILKSDHVQETVTLKKIELVSGTSRLQWGNNGVMNLTNGALNGLASTNSITLEGSTVLNTTQSQPNVTALVAPMPATETRLSFRLTVDVAEADGTSTEQRSFETATVNEVQWKAGYHYVYAITVDKMGGSLTNIQIDAWKNDANQNTGIGI
ncbi:fimbrillin family protein [Bacteroides timonensis]|uniref:fimbrillin family protein n=1 Tax=Bacteroides timonensis TaxID=1470345 RepID=UPI001FCBF0E9|nr:fimbrillin family protein [Bacteroides timonensis]